MAPQRRTSSLWIFIADESTNSVSKVKAKFHVSITDLRKCNPSLSMLASEDDVIIPRGTKVYLPLAARLDDENPLLFIAASHPRELAPLLTDLLQGSHPVEEFHCMGRKYYRSHWHVCPVLLFATGGGLGNPAIAVTNALRTFSIAQFCYLGIAGGSNGLNVGDVVIADGVLPSIGQGNIAPLATPSGDTVVGQFWWYSGDPVVSDQGVESHLLLQPSRAFSKEVKAWARGWSNEPSSLSTFPIRHGWTSSGPFVTCAMYLQQLAERCGILAEHLGIEPPQYIACDHEDYGAIQAVVEAGVTEWVVIRVIVDNASEPIGDEDAMSRGVPWEERNNPEQPWKWLKEQRRATKQSGCPAPLPDKIDENLYERPCAVLGSLAASVCKPS